MVDVVGTNNDDSWGTELIGSDGDDSYFGLEGDDWLIPTLGNDVLDGGAGSDVAIYSYFDIFTNGVTINNTDTAIGGVAAFTTDKRGFGFDTLADMENFHGTNYDDVIYLGFAPDGSYSFDEWGDDLVVAFQGLTEEGHYFAAGPGNDTYQGSVADNDQIDFAGAYTGFETGITVIYTGIGTGTATDPWGGTDLFSGIEQIAGSDQDDLIETGDGDNDIVGFGGDDILRGGGGRDDIFGHAGDDIIDGGAGDRDEVRYDNDADEGGTFGVTVDLAAGTATDGFGDTDTLIGIEEVRGTQEADTILGDSGENRLQGEGGDDTLRGRAGDDDLSGGTGDDRLFGGAGRDALEGGAGDDLLDGGAGDNDEVYYDNDADEGGANGVTVDLIAGTATDGFGDTDTLVGIERVSGTEFADTISGDDRHNELFGGGGDDTLTGLGGEDYIEGGGGDDALFGGDGQDELDGGAGNDLLDGGASDDDRVRYDHDAEEGGTNGVTVDLAAGTATDGFGDTDTLVGIERVRGTDSADSILGDGLDNELEGGGGDDTLTGRGGDDYIAGDAGDDRLFGGAGRDDLSGGAGDDLIDGGAGDGDQVRYENDADEGGTSGVTVDLAAGTATDGFGDTDTLIGIEGVRGTDFADTISGDDQRNWISGGDGDDTLTAVRNPDAANDWDTGDDLSGGAGDDTLIGSAGRDYLQPGTGTDVVHGGDHNRGGDTIVYAYDDATAGITASFTGLGTGTVIDWAGDTDTFTGIENVRGTDHADTITADDGDNQLEGHGGNDTLFGLAGQDYLGGGDGDDYLDGGDGGDYFRPGAGTDTIIGGDTAGILGQEDELSYRHSDATAGIAVTFSNATDGTVDDWSGSTDIFTGIELVEGTNHADTFIGADGDDEFRGFGGDDFFDGGAGDRDEVDYKGADPEDGAFQGVTLSLVTGIATDAWGDTDTLIGIENVEGTKHWGDILIGDDTSNRLSGGGGDDVIDGGGGDNNDLEGGEGSDTIISRGNNDYVNTGAGDDTVTVYGENVYIEMGLGDNTILSEGAREIFLSYQEYDQGVTVDLAAGTALKQGGAVDTFSDVTEVRGSLGDDTLLGGEAEFEQFAASVGNDSVDGRGGEDQLSYQGTGSGDVTFDLVAGTATLAGWGTTTFAGIERHEGGGGNDTFLGDAENNEFRGLGGVDFYDGGDGFDRVSFAGDWFNGGQDGIFADLAGGTATDGYGNVETLVSIESIFGGEAADTIRGDAGENGLWAGNDDDVIDARGGNDWLSGGFGTDTLTGGAGDDAFYGWLGHLDGDTVTDLQAGDRIAVYADGWGALLGANITADAANIHIDVTGDGIADATMVNLSGYTGPVQSEGGPVGGPIPAVIRLDAAGGLAASLPEGTGGDSDVAVTLTRSGDIFAAVTVDYAVAGAGSNPADAGDLAAGFGTGQVTFAAGQTIAQIALTIVGDAVIETDERISVTLTGVTSDGAVPAEIAGGAETYVRILNDDTLQRVDIAGSRAQEDTGDLVFTLTREGPDLSQALTATVRLSGGDGPRQASPDDVVGGLPQTVTVDFAPGEDSASFTLQPVADGISEFHETVVAQIVSLGGAAAPSFEIGSGQAVGDIRNDDGIPPIPPGLDASSAMDPHLFTFDGLSYDFQAVGEFVLLEAVDGDPLSIQVRYQPVPGSDYASHATAVATAIGGVSVSLDLTADDPLKIGGTATDLADAAGGRTVGDGTVYFDGVALTVVYGNGEQMRVDVFESFLNVSAFIGAGRDVQGLLGNANGDAGDDLATRDGTILTQPVSFADLYGTYADSWRIDAGESLFDYAPGQGTADFTDTTFPRGEISLDTLPQAVLDRAAAATEGITDPILKQAAMLDFVLTGNGDYIAAAAEIAPETAVRVTPEDAPAPAAAIGVYAVDQTLTEGDSGVTEAIFTLYRTGDLSQAISLAYTLGGDVDAADLAAASGGTVAFASGEAAQSVSVAIMGDTVAETDETLSLSFRVTDGDAGILSSVAATTILNDDVAPPEPAFNTVTGTDGSDNLVGTDGADALIGLGGSYDRLRGGGGEDVFVFGAEADNARRERDVIRDYEVGIDSILLTDGAGVARVRDTSYGAVVFLDGDGDAIYVRGHGVTSDTLTFLTADDAILG